ncbi:hypothetical protein Tel_04505 [Candidatus Tenderia electrophaga]|jgi:MOSC domain-containing protein YiiM|uniref:MOSC domain-containing protein n=1 Tax=Candidatus Tenderia electrophaga TaxID=1748243 RepID=A0A0S2TBD9_9GAMM|nr:hypothetical protein Tel_04505 [Candidatus Tenderia electrophaga]
MARLLGIAKRARKRAAMQLLQTAEIRLEHGVADDFRGKSGARQVTVLTREAWQAACAELGLGAADTLPWTTRRANLLIQGLDLRDSSGRILKVGEVELLISRETDPCERMEQACPGLLAAMAKEWRGGVCCRVLVAGRIQIGDPVALVDAD